MRLSTEMQEKIKTRSLSSRNQREFSRNSRVGKGKINADWISLERLHRFSQHRLLTEESLSGERIPKSVSGKYNCLRTLTLRWSSWMKMFKEILKITGQKNHRMSQPNLKGFLAQPIHFPIRNWRSEQWNDSQDHTAHLDLRTPHFEFLQTQVFAIPQRQFCPLRKLQRSPEYRPSRFLRSMETPLPMSWWLCIQCYLSQTLSLP